jgi:hypothetical protein
MSRPDRLTGSVDARFHPVSHYNSPADVLNDEVLSPPEKRVILSSWASDLYAVDSCPALRKIPGLVAPMHLEDILAALRQLDEEENVPGVGAAAVRFSAQAQQTARNRQPRIAISAKSRWSSEANVRRYRRLLATHLTENERRFVEHRLAEELAQLRSQSNVAESSESQ